MNRRSVLALFGGGMAVVGLGSYHQRRRLRRWSDRNELHAALDIEYPTVASQTYLRPTEAHLSDALDELAERVDAARGRWPDEEIEADEQEHMAHSDRQFERANATLEEVEEQRGSFGELSATERLDVLDTLRLGLGSAEQAVALADLQRGERTRNDVIANLEALRDEYEAALDSLPYIAPDFSWAVMAYGELNEWLDDVRGSIRMGERYVHGEGVVDTIEPQYAASRAASARARLADIDQFRDSLEEMAQEDTTADSLEQKLDDAYVRLEERTDTKIGQVDFQAAGGTEGVRSHAQDILIQEIAGIHGGPGDAYEEAYLALAVRRQVEHHAYARILPVFEGVPSARQPRGNIPALDTTGADVRDAKDRATGALEDRLAADRNDPLVRHLCATFVVKLEWQERRLERHLDEINEHASDVWAVELERTRLRYREVEELAAVIPDAIAAAADGVAS